MTFSEKLKTLRLQKGYSQEELAAQLHVSRQAIAKWEGNNGMPDIENIKAISKLFQVSLDYLLNEEYDTSSKSYKNRVDLIVCGSLIGAAFQFLLDGGFFRGLLTGGIIMMMVNYLMHYFHEPMPVMHFDYLKVKNKIVQINKTSLFMRLSGALIGGLIALYLWNAGIL